jgi:Uma2 family endonuclease
LSEPVDAYWIVDPESRSVERWRRGDDRPEIADGVLRWQPLPGVPPLELDLPDLFARALDRP